MRLFLVLVFLLSWPIWFASGVLARAGGGAYDYRWLIAQIGVLGPSLSAVIASATIRKNLRRNSLRILPVLLLPIAVPGLLIARGAPNGVAGFGKIAAAAALIVGAAVILFFSPMNRGLRSPGTGAVIEKPERRWVFYSIAFFPLLFFVSWFLANAGRGGWEIAALKNGTGAFAWIIVVSFAHNILLGGPLGEEIGWRGFLLPQLLQRTTPLASSLILGVVWGVWHLPIDIYAGFLVTGPGAVLARVVWTFPLAVLFTWFYLRSRGSLLVALFLHASIGMLADFGFSQYPSALMVFFIAMAIAAIVVASTSPEFRVRS